MMISSVDQDAVCGHFKAMLSGVLQDDEIQRAVGQLNSLAPDKYELVAKELATVFTYAFLGQFDIPTHLIPHIGLSKRKSTYVTRDNSVVSGNKYKTAWVDKVLHLPPGPRTYRIWASMTNLKSACVIFDLSRSEKSAQCEAIRRTVTIDEDLLEEWRAFVDEFTPYLLKRLWLDGDVERKFNPIWTIPKSVSVSTRTIDRNGKLVSCQKGDPEALDPTYQLKHPVVNRIARAYPKEFAEALFIGKQVTGDVEFFIPEPFAQELPIGASALAPKRAEKPRTVWILILMLDCASRPAFHHLEKIIEKWNLQGVMDHDKARSYIRERLSRNNEMGGQNEFCSYDQSAFTDNFSYNKIQRPIVQALVKNNFLTPYDLMVIDELNHGLWDLKSLGIKHELVRFGTGTGMGTPPSFPLASIANAYMVAFAYWKTYNKFPNPTVAADPPGKVVGDDCTIFESAVGDEYEIFCAQIGLVINRTKSFRSRDTAEFCGKIITKEGIYDKRKLKDFPSLSSFIDTCKYYGGDSAKFFSAYEEQLGLKVYDMIDTLREIPEPFGLKEFPYHSVPYEELSVVDQMATSQIEMNAMESVMDPDLRGHEKDIRRIIIRKDRCPEIHCTDFTPVFKTVREVPELDPYRKELVHNAITDFKENLSSASWDQIVQSGRFLNQVYLALVKDDPDFFEKYRRPQLPTLSPKEKGGRPSFIDKAVKELGSRMEPQELKGGFTYDL